MRKLITHVPRAHEVLQVVLRRSSLATAALLANPRSPSLGQTLIRRSASSSTQWKTRQAKDQYSKEAKVQGLKSRAAFKLLEINSKYKLFRPGDTVVDLGFAPGSWSQVAISRTAPNGRVIGIDIIPAQPPKGVSTIQGNFLSPAIQAEVRAYVQDSHRGRLRKRIVVSQTDAKEEGQLSMVDESQEANQSYIEFERQSSADIHEDGTLEESNGLRADLEGESAARTTLSLKERDEAQGRVVNVVLSDMSAPWDQTTGLWVKSVSDPYRRMMNTSGVNFKDHAGSMDLCLAATTFCFDILRTGGHFVCKFYQGAEDKALENTLKRFFEKVHRDKPDSSRSESKEAYFVALRRKETPERTDVFK